MTLILGLVPHCRLTFPSVYDSVLVTYNSLPIILADLGDLLPILGLSISL
jgi:hypothetical protein